jgi:hypothetical protein
MLGVGGGEDDERRPLESAQHVGAEQSRHLHVEEHELRSQLVDPAQRALPVGRR